jgi:hypothetical protein
VDLKLAIFRLNVLTARDRVYLSALPDVSFKMDRSSARFTSMVSSQAYAQAETSAEESSAYADRIPAFARKFGIEHALERSLCDRSCGTLPHYCLSLQPLSSYW